MTAQMMVPALDPNTGMYFERPATAAEIAEIQSTQAQAASDAAAASKVATATAWVQLRMTRDRWLAQTDYLEVFLAGGFSPLPQPIQDAITQNKTAWLSWRQALRDLPAAQGLDPVAATKAAGSIHATSDTFPTPWPQPPAAPVIHLT